MDDNSNNLRDKFINFVGKNEKKVNVFVLKAALLLMGVLWVVTFFKEGFVAGITFPITLVKSILFNFVGFFAGALIVVIFIIIIVPMLYLYTDIRVGKVATDIYNFAKDYYNVRKEENRKSRKNND